MADKFSQDLIAMLPNLRRFAISLTRSRDVADDMVQLTCEKALSNRDSFKAGTRFDAWLFKIMRNTWIDHVRRDRARGDPVDVDEAADLAGDDGTARSESRLMLDSTANAIAALPEDQRAVMMLVCVEDLSYREASEVLEVPIGTIMSRLARARNRLSKSLGIEPTPARSPEERKGA